MAEKRMFSKKVIDTDWFMDMPASTQNLYFHLSLRADDDGFVSNPKRILKLVGSTDDDYKLLVVKKFIIPFESGVCVITDWRINNYLRNDRYTETIYQEEKRRLFINENGKYNLGIPTVDQMVYQRLPQYSIELDKNVCMYVNNNKEINTEYIKKNIRTHEKLQSYEEIFSSFNVEKQLQNVLWEFIKHCQLNKKTLTNDKLQKIICALDMNYQTLEEKIKSVSTAISKGYFDIKERL